MPKIQQIKGHNDTSFFMQSIPKRDLSQFRNRSGSRTAARSIHDSIVPIHEVSYNPQFSKSPLANVEMQKKAHIQPTDLYEQESVYYDFKSRIQGIPLAQKQKTTWKTILLRVLIVLLIIGAIVGLYFLIDAILSHKFSHQSQQPSASGEGTKKVYPSVEMEPIYFDPISYDSMSTYSTPAKGSSASIYKNSVPLQTFPSALPSQMQYQTSSMGNGERNDGNGRQKKNSRTMVKNTDGQVYQRNSPYQSYDYLENSVAPINAYESTP